MTLQELALVYHVVASYDQGVAYYATLLYAVGAFLELSLVALEFLVLSCLEVAYLKLEWAVVAYPMVVLFDEGAPFLEYFVHGLAVVVVVAFLDNLDTLEM